MLLWCARYVLICMRAVHRACARRYPGCGVPRQRPTITASCVLGADISRLLGYVFEFSVLRWLSAADGHSVLEDAYGSWQTWQTWQPRQRHVSARQQGQRSGGGDTAYGSSRKLTLSLVELRPHKTK